MVTKRILLFGGNSQTGKALKYNELPHDWHLGIFTRAECDFTRAGDIARAMKDFRPDLVINAAAMTDLEACEKEPELAMHINFNAVATIVSHCVEADAPLIQLSTNNVFDGRDRTVPYAPDDAMNPVNAYGLSKMFGEEAARHGSYGHVILRSSLVFSADGENVLTRTLRQIDTADTIRIASDHVANPTSANHLAQGLILIANSVLDGKAHCYGTFHLCDEPAVTLYEFTQAIMEAYAPFTERRPAIVGVANAVWPEHALRPQYSAINCEKTQAIYGIKPQPWREDLAAAVRCYAQQKTAQEH
jgi:dTDP-4-dehydrorhamnose reductase